ncbi:MAG TPA: homoserine dehydrogenase [Clostridiales bacterium]|jgi:homoserine dehydrogenase|nr:homoserine dehydrogenase [Clostridiales bacterium]
MISVALLGFGNIGSGTAEVLSENGAQIERYVGCPISIKYILDRRDFPSSPWRDRIVRDFDIILNDPQIKIVAEMLGGLHPAYEFTKAALMAGKHVVTPNKEVVAKFGAELLEIAAEKGVRYLFEGSVGGGIPIIRPLINDLAANGIISVSGILNGTTNYILTRMERDKTSYRDALAEAQALGYAEPNPASDVSGADAARKIVILAALAFGKLVDPDVIHTEGIAGITQDDIRVAAAFGCAIKLVAHTELVNGRVFAMVAPHFVEEGNPLFGVSDVFNGILVEGDLIGRVMFYGPGAGRLPTASAVVADIADIAFNIGAPARKLHWDPAEACDIADFGGCSCRSCFIFADTPGGVDKLEECFGNLGDVVRDNGRMAFVSETLTEKEADARAAACGLPFIKRFRIL